MALSNELATSVLEQTLEDGGGTFHNDGTPIDTREHNGYAVSINEELGRVVPLDEVTPTTISVYFHDMTRENKMIGTWVDDGKLYLDVVTVVPDKKLALQIAQYHCQIAIYDLYNGNEINVEAELKG